MEDIAERLYVDDSAAFRYLKQHGYNSKLDAWEIGNEFL